MDIAQVPASERPSFLDGRSLFTYIHSTVPSPIPEVINIEYWGGGLDEKGMRFEPRNTYKTVRIIGDGYSYLYSHWCTQETELYDTHADPYELSPVPPESNRRLHDRLNGVLLVSKSCSETSCRNPWTTLHPDGSVKNLRDALNKKHDKFYSALPRVAFKECLSYQHTDNEAPYLPSLKDGVSLGAKHRDVSAGNGVWREPRARVGIKEIGYFGEKYETLEELEMRSRYLTEEEMGREDRERRWKGLVWFLSGVLAELKTCFWRTVAWFWMPSWGIDVDYL